MTDALPLPSAGFPEARPNSPESSGANERKDPQMLHTRSGKPAEGGDRFGIVKLSTIRRDFDRLRSTIRAHDVEATEAAWLDCERWLPWVEAENVRERKE